MKKNGIAEIISQQREGYKQMGTVGVIGLHLVSGPLVGFAIGYGLDVWLECTPIFKLAFFLIGIGAGFLNVWIDTKNLLQKMDKSDS